MSIDEQIKTMPTLAPEALDDFQIVRHFCDRPIFIRSFYGPIKLKSFRRDSDYEILFAKGHSVRDEQKPDHFRHLPDSLMIRLSDRAFAQLTSRKITVYSETEAEAKEHLETLTECLAPRDNLDAPYFNLITCDHNCWETTSVFLENETPMDEAEFKLHYGEDFPEWHQRLVDNLASRESGITVLRGNPGTGKTTYLRKLIVALSKSHLFLFMPLKSGWMLNAPETVHFWVNQKRQHPGRKLAIILEDAEHFLMQRSTDNASAVSDLLNASDGLLGNFLQLHLICTLNCGLEKLDPAVTRPGRLLAYREFSRLTPAQAQKLAAAKNLSIGRQDSYSLAEIYRGGNQAGLPNNERKIGFQNRHD